MGKEEKNTEGAQQTETNRGGASSDSNVNNSGPAAPEGETDRGESKEADKPGDATSDVPEAPSSRKEKEEKKSTAEDTAVTASENEDHEEISNPIAGGEGGKPMAVVSHGKKDRPTYKYDPNKITLRFLFANRDGLTVTCECKPSDTVGEVKGALLSVWPSGKFGNAHFVQPCVVCIAYDLAYGIPLSLHGPLRIDLYHPSFPLSLFLRFA